MQVELYILLSSGDEEKEGNIYLNWVICVRNIQTTQIFPYCYADHLFQYFRYKRESANSWVFFSVFIIRSHGYYRTSLVIWYFSMKSIFPSSFLLGARFLFSFLLQLHLPFLSMEFIFFLTFKPFWNILSIPSNDSTTQWGDHVPGVIIYLSRARVNDWMNVSA